MRLSLLFLSLSTLSFRKQVNNFLLLCPFTVFEQTEAVVQRCSVKKVFLNISQKSQGNICATVCFNFIKKETLAQVFPCEFFRNFYEHLFLKNSSGNCFWTDFCLTDFISRACKTQHNMCVSLFFEKLISSSIKLLV